MTEHVSETPLDRAHAAMQAAPEDDDGQRGYYAALAASELFVLLTEEAQDDLLSPDVFDLGDARFVLAFDTEARLSQFAGRIVPYAGVSGRTLAQMLAGQGVGLAVNLDVASSAMLLPPEAMTWLVDMLGDGPDVAEAQIEEILPPLDLPEVLLPALDARLAAAAGLARAAYLVGVRYGDGTRSHLLGVLDAVAGAEQTLAGNVQEALRFSGLEAGALDVAFFASSDPMAAALARHGLRFDLPEPEAPMAPQPPGMDPDRPPKLT